MLKVEKIQKRVELLDLEVQADPCKWHWDQDRDAGLYDCLEDCAGPSPYASDKY